VLKVQQTAVKRLLRNLIENAIKFGDRADVAVEIDGQSVALLIDDAGPGIPEDKLSAVQQPFVRLEESRNRSTGGLGLGLSIARAIAQSQGAKLELINRTNGGLRARVSWTGTRVAE
jgi:signal transduction histidine kinase